MGRAEAVVGVGDDGAEVEDFVGHVDVILCAVPRSSHIGVVVVEGDGAGHVVALLGHDALEAHDAAFPCEHVFPPVDGVVDACRAVLAHDTGVHVIHHLLALYVNGRGCGMVQDIHPVLVGVFCHVPEAVDGAVFDVDAQGGIVGDEPFAAERGIPNVLDVEERFVLGDGKHVQSAVECDGATLHIGALDEF